MKLLVTDTAGFIELEFSRAARDAGHEVTGLVQHPADSLATIKTDTLIRDVHDMEPTDLQSYDAIMHFAATTSSDDDAFLSVTINETAACLSATIDAKVPKFMHISSASIYPGRLPALIADTLNIPLKPHPQKKNIYPQSKIKTNQLVSQT